MPGIVLQCMHLENVEQCDAIFFSGNSIILKRNCIEAMHLVRAKTTNGYNYTQLLNFLLN